MASQISDKKGTKKPKKRSRVESEKFDRISSLNWQPIVTEKDDAFSFLIGSNELEGGLFFCLFALNQLYCYFLIVFEKPHD